MKLGLSYLLLCLATLTSAFLQDDISPPPEVNAGHKKDAAFSGKSTKLLNVIQVTNPVNVPGAACSLKLMEHSFAWSYGHPFVGNYTPPDCVFNRVALTITVTSLGRQFDRLALMCMLFIATVDLLIRLRFQRYWSLENFDGRAYSEWNSMDIRQRCLPSLVPLSKAPETHFRPWKSRR
jgi:Peptide N-acetyl-beta-D-glucosaminyl asparaginase amidase A